MLSKLHPGIMVVFGCLGLLACASPKSPTGGPKDVTPPAVVESASTPSKQTNFHEKTITIVFDEWVTIKDIISQLVVSPLMPHDPEVKQKGKGIVIKLPDSLREETTYTINFGNSIADLNEGNVLENYAFVFSTGSVLDSARLSGVVTDAQSLKPADGVFVMLYPAGEDSAVYKRKPEYLTKTNKEGKWSLENLRTDSFNVVALKDQNLNFLYDQDGESIGWLDGIIYTDIPFAELPVIWIFPRENRIAVTDVIHYAPGWLKVVVKSPEPKPVPEFVPGIENSVTAWDKDTLHIWYDPQKNYSGMAILYNDTTRIRASQNPNLATHHTEIRLTSGRLRPGLPAAFISNVPITSIDTSKMTLYHDSIGIISYKIDRDERDPRRFSIHAPWIGATKYHMTFLPGAITDFWGRSNDTIKLSVVVTGADQYGDLMMTIDGLDSTKQYILFLKEGEQIIDTFVIRNQPGIKLTKKGLLPGKYGLELVEDLNQNGSWDTGDYNKRRHAERKMIFTPENLRSGWEQEVKMMWKIN